MKQIKKSLVFLAALCLTAGMLGGAMSVSAAEIGAPRPVIPPAPAAPVAETEPAAPAEPVAESYAYNVDGDTFDFYDYAHKISIIGGTLKEGKDISFYGLNEEGNLAVVYFNVKANEGKGVVAANDSMVYVTYADGKISEVERAIGTTGLFGFDMSLADPSMEGMMKVFNASLGSFLKAYGAEVADYSAISGGGALSGAIEYARGKKTTLLLKDDNYITNKKNASDVAFMANEWGIYSGYMTVDGVDYNTFCFFGNQNDVYYYGYAQTETGMKVLNMKGTVRKNDDRTKTVTLQPVNMSKTSDDASQYITKMASCLMAAQNYPSMNLDTLRLCYSYDFVDGKFGPVIYASTDNGFGTLTYSDGVFSGKIEDENGNAETLSVKIGRKDFIVTAQTTGVFTVARSGCYYGSLNEARPFDCSYDYYWWYPFWTPFFYFF